MTTNSSLLCLAFGVLAGVTAFLLAREAVG